MQEIQNKKICCFHLLNDYSGSATVLSMVVNGLERRGYSVELCTSRGNGALSSFANVVHTYRYEFSTRPLFTLFRYLRVQLNNFIYVLFKRDNVDFICYINTILPVGAAVAAKLCGMPVVYHCHENASVKGFHYRVLSRIMQTIADEIICVSQYQASLLKRKERVYVIPNALPEEFIEKLVPNVERAFNSGVVLMLSSLKSYKGIRQFSDLSELLPEYKFILVISNSDEEIDEFFSVNGIVRRSNMVVLSRQKDVSPFYNNASILVNLTDPRIAIETFGLTALEALSCGVPVIVPQVGGISELVNEGQNGYKIDCNDYTGLTEAIKAMLSDRELYYKLSNNALRKAAEYSEDSFLGNLETVICHI